MTYQPKPPGYFWSWLRLPKGSDKGEGSWYRDSLCEMEEWAARHPEKMDAERQRKLDTERWRYRLARELIEREGIKKADKESIAQMPWRDWETIDAVLKRINREKKLNADKEQEGRRGRVRSEDRTSASRNGTPFVAPEWTGEGRLNYQAVSDETV